MAYEGPEGQSASPEIDIPALEKQLHALKNRVAPSIYVFLYREFQLLRAEAEIEGWTPRDIVAGLIKCTDSQRGPARQAIMELAFELFPSLVPADEVPVPRELPPPSLDAASVSNPVQGRQIEVRDKLAHVDAEGDVVTGEAATSVPFRHTMATIAGDMPAIRIEDLPQTGTDLPPASPADADSDISSRDTTPPPAHFSQIKGREIKIGAPRAARVAPPPPPKRLPRDQMLTHADIEGAELLAQASVEVEEDLDPSERRTLVGVDPRDLARTRRPQADTEPDPKEKK